jgi:lipoprotein signal peptidase
VREIQFPHKQEESVDLGTLIAAILTLFIFSFLYKDNPFYKFAEYLLVGISVGYFIVISIKTTVVPKLIFPIFREGDLLYLIPGILGFFMFLRFLPKLAWLSRISMALIIGAGAGVSIPAMMQAQIFAQMKASMGSYASINNIIVVLAVITTLSYFFFSREHKGALGTSAKIGVFFMMLFFGATFGYTVMSRVTLLIGRAQFLLGDFLGIIK